MAVPPKFAGHRLVFPSHQSNAQPPFEVPLHTLEFYIDYVCPYSAKLFRSLTSNVLPFLRTNPEYGNKVQLILRPQIQPWHPSSTLVHEAALAVQRILSDKAPDQFWNFAQRLFQDQAAYFDEAVVDETRNDTYRRLAKLAEETVAIDAGEVFKLLQISGKEKEEAARNAGNAVTADVKYIVKTARLTGVHVTPTVLFNGVVANEISSSWGPTEWLKYLQENIV
ncbi:hypothetical protein B0J18DRAFT_240287 [Chaetomium sp. MPI-SDFR-AT-0129]|nr:hypothetical protein B0J18DRAFT_240287 [Chaetomium sp. MPI-SDFR-AT-0129]